MEKCRPSGVPSGKARGGEAGELEPNAAGPREREEEGREERRRGREESGEGGEWEEAVYRRAQVGRVHMQGSGGGRKDRRGVPVAGPRSGILEAPSRARTPSPVPTHDGSERREIHAQARIPDGLREREDREAPDQLLAARGLAPNEDPRAQQSGRGPGREPVDRLEWMMLARRGVIP